MCGSRGNVIDFRTRNRSQEREDGQFPALLPRRGRWPCLGRVTRHRCSENKARKPRKRRANRIEPLVAARYPGNPGLKSVVQVPLRNQSQEISPP
jgi:hypothetical protein